MGIIFLGGIFVPRQKNQIERDEKGILQNAADALQKALLAGLADVTGEELRIINLPFIGSFPQAYRRWWFPGTRDRIKGAEAFGVGFVNVRFVRVLSRFLSASFGIARAFRAESGPLVVYSAELPLVVAAALHQFWTKGRVCLVLPDLPEFVGDLSWWRRFVIAVEGGIFRYCIKRFDSFVVLTEAMAERLDLTAGSFVVVEGMIDLDPLSGAEEAAAAPGAAPFFLYTGAIEKRYGIVDLINAFQKLHRDDIRLVICGDGGARREVEALAHDDDRIEYRGQVPRDAALSLQNCAYALVNPRPPHGEFTRYSFPSKTLEYLASGRPVIMHDLPGVPHEYAEHILVASSPDIGGLTIAMEHALAMSPDEIRAAAVKSRRFLESRKTPSKQCERIADLIFRERS